MSGGATALVCKVLLLAAFFALAVALGPFSEASGCARRCLRFRNHVRDANRLGVTLRELPTDFNSSRDIFFVTSLCVGNARHSIAAETRGTGFACRH
jgi:hypothetical protein